MFYSYWSTINKTTMKRRDQHFHPMDAYMFQWCCISAMKRILIKDIECIDKRDSCPSILVSLHFFLEYKHLILCCHFDSTNLYSCNLIMCAYQKSSYYQYNSCWFDSIGARTQIYRTQGKKANHRCFLFVTAITYI